MTAIWEDVRSALRPFEGPLKELYALIDGVKGGDFEDRRDAGISATAAKVGDQPLIHDASLGKPLD